MTILRLMAVSVLLLCCSQPVLVSSQQLDVYQARARLYYEAGVDENALWGRAWIASQELRPGMYAPDFAVMDLDGDMHTLSQQQAERFIVVVTGNAT